MRRAFTLVELLIAVSMLGVLTAFAVLSFHAVSSAWQTSCEYMDKMQRADYALDQVVSGLRSLYYPHNGKQDANYGFVLTDNGKGEDVDSSDVIEWSKSGSALVGSGEAVADTVHRVQLLVLEEGNSDYREPIEVTGLYVRLCGDAALRPDEMDKDYTFTNDQMYQPTLVADGVVGMNCRVMPTDDKADEENDTSLFKDEWTETNAVPYKVELTFRIADPEGRAYRTNTAPLVRIIRIPLYEQAKDGAATPNDSAAAGGAQGGGGRGPSGGNGRPGGGPNGGRPGGGFGDGPGAGGPPGGGGPAPGGGAPR